MVFKQNFFLPSNPWYLFLIILKIMKQRLKLPLLYKCIVPLILIVISLFKPEYKKSFLKLPITSLLRTFIKYQKKASQNNNLLIKFSRIHLVSRLDFANLVDLSHKNKPPKCLVPLRPSFLQTGIVQNDCRFLCLANSATQV